MGLIEQILIENKMARNSDDILYDEVCSRLTDGLCKIMTFSSFLNARSSLDLPPYETVSRVRRKLQAKKPNLRASADVEAERMLREEEFREYAKV